MTIHLPDDLVASLEASVRSGLYASVDEAIAEAVQLRFGYIPGREQATPPAAEGDLGPDLVLGSMRDAADELDQIVADAYRARRGEKWRDVDVE